MKIVNFAVNSIYGAIVLLLLLDLKPFIIFIANGIVTSTSKYDIDPYLVIEKIIFNKYTKTKLAANVLIALSLPTNIA